MGVVYLVIDTLFNQRVALKQLRRLDAPEAYYLKREFRSLADVEHPNLVRMHELYADMDECFFTMEYVEGERFLDFIWHADSGAAATIENPTALGEAETGALTFSSYAGRSPATVDLARLRAALSQLVEGVAALHGFGLLHRDLKPSNVMVTLQGRLVILDFGLATARERAGASVSAHEFAGTPAYMAPEQGFGAAVTAASDWYSVGVMIFESLTGRWPFTGSSGDIIRAKRTLEAPVAADISSGVPDDLNELCRMLLRIDPSARPGPHEIMNAVGLAVSRARPRTSVTAPSFIGREEPLALLSAAVAACGDGRPSVAMISGASGIGKTALVRGFLEGPDAARALVIQGRCYERETVPFKTIDSVMDELCRHVAAMPPHQLAAILPLESEALARVFPALRRVLRIVPVPRRSREIPDQQELRRRAFGAFRELLHRLIEWRPVIVFVDDLQWGDADSSALLAHVLSPPDPPPVCLLICYRADEHDAPPVRSMWDICERLDPSQIRKVPLGPLAPRDAEAVATALLRLRGSAPVSIAHRIAQESEGHPYFLAELVRAADGLTEKGTSTAGDGAASLEMILKNRIVALEDGPRRLLSVVALAGRPITVTIAAQAAGLSDHHALSVRVLKHERLVLSRSGVRGTTLETYHDRIRDIAVDLIAPRERSACHRVLATVLEDAGDEYLEGAADHYQLAEMPERVAALSLLAGDRATAALAFDRAARFYRRALDSGASDPDGEVLAKLGDALANSGRGRNAAGAYLEAASRPGGGALVLARQRRAAEELLRAGHFDAGLKQLETVLRTAGMQVPRTPRRALLSLLPRRALLAVRGVRWRRRQLSAIAPSTITAIDICWAAVIGLARIDNIRAAEFQSRHLLLALRAGEPYRVARALCAEAGFSATSGAVTLQRTRRLIEWATQVAESIGHPHALGLARFASALAAYYIGDFRRAEEYSGAATAILQEQCTGVGWELNTLRTVELASLYYLGALGKLARRVPAHLREALDRGDLYAATDLSVGRANVAWLVRDDVDGAREAVATVMRQWSSRGFHAQHFFALLAEGQIALYTGDVLAYLRVLELRWSDVAHSLILRVRFNRAEVYHLRARALLAAAALAGGDNDDRLAHVTRLAGRISKEPVACGRPWAALLKAGVANRRGRSELCVALLDEAIDGFDGANMALYACAARWRKGAIVGGTAGTELRERATTSLRAEGVQAPVRMLQMAAPGFQPDA
jgi:hypothetical protein